MVTTWLLKDLPHVVRHLALQFMEQIDLVLTPFSILSFSEEELPRQSVNCTHLERHKEISQQVQEKHVSRISIRSDTLKVSIPLLLSELNYRKLCRDMLQFSENKVSLKKVANKFMKFLKCTAI